jgi:hypothetical protein
LYPADCGSRSDIATQQQAKKERRKKHKQLLDSRGSSAIWIVDVNEWLKRWV